MTIEKVQTRDRKIVNPEEINQFLSTINPQEKDLHFLVRKISLYIADIFLYRDALQKLNKKDAILEALNMDMLGTIEQNLFNERRSVVEGYVISKIHTIKKKVASEDLMHMDTIKINLDRAFGKMFSKELIDQHNKQIFLLMTQEMLDAMKDECYALTQLSSQERQKILDTLYEKYPNMSKKFVHRIRLTTSNDEEMLRYVDAELEWIGKLFLENIPKNNSFIEYLGRVCDVWQDLVDFKNLYIQYQEYIIDVYSQEIEKSLRRKENDRKGPIKKEHTKEPSNLLTAKKEIPQRYNHEVQIFINHFFPEQFLLHKDLQRIYRKNNFFYKDDLVNRLHIDQLSPEMEIFCEKNGIIVIERQKEIIPVTLSESNEQVVRNKIVLPSNTIESRLIDISTVSLENRVGEYIGLFKELGYSFTKEEEFAQRTLEMCRSNIAIEKSIKKLLKDRSNGIEEIKKIGRDFYTFQLYNGCRIVLPKKGEILSIGSHDQYETLLKNNF